MSVQFDHLVVVARTLDEGVAWCEASLGITPGAGGEHVLFGTHNRLLRIATVNFPRAYLEIIAINPQASAAGRRPGARWFDMDDAQLQAQVAKSPRLVHFVASTSSMAKSLLALQGVGIDRGVALPAQRLTSQGLLQWLISVRADGQRLFQGALPTLIEWQGAEFVMLGHPIKTLPDCGLALHSLRVSHPQAAQLQAAYAALDLSGVSITQGEPNLIAQLITPRGLITLESNGV